MWQLLSPELQDKINELQKKQIAQAYQLYLDQHKSLTRMDKKRYEELNAIDAADKSRTPFRGTLDMVRYEIIQEYNNAAIIAREEHKKQWDQLVKKQEEKLAPFKKPLPGSIAKGRGEPIELDNPFNNPHAS